LIVKRIETGFSGILREEKREERAACPFERFDVPQCPEKPALRVGRKAAPARSIACQIALLSGGGLSLPATHFVSISTSSLSSRHP
jgi:hypothetical protein